MRWTTIDSGIGCVKVMVAIEASPIANATGTSMITSSANSPNRTSSVTAGSPRASGGWWHLDAASAEQDCELSEQQVNGRQQHRGGRQRERQRVEPAARQFDRQRDRLRSPFDTHHLDALHDQHHERGADEQPHQHAQRRRHAGRQMRAHGGDQDVATLLETDAGTHEGHPDEGIGGRLLHPRDRPAERVAREHLHRDRTHHQGDQCDADAALGDADRVEQALETAQHRRCGVPFVLRASGSAPTSRRTRRRPFPSWPRRPWHAAGSAPCRSP